MCSHVHSKESIMKQLSPRILTLAQAGVLGIFTAHAALAATEVPEFAQYDVNKDHIVTLEEFAARGGIEKAFRAGDANGDGALNQDEFIKALANNDRAKAGKYLDDAWITTKVKAQLLKEVKLKGLDVGVETQQGTVVLSGAVATPEQAAQAERIAAGVEGVKSVRNELQVKAKG